MTTTTELSLAEVDRLMTARLHYVNAMSLGWVGKDAFERISTLIGHLATIDPLELLCGGENALSGHQGDSLHYRMSSSHPDDIAEHQPNPLARRHLRLLCCLVGPQVPDDELPEAVRAMVGNRWLTYDIVRDVLAGEEGDTGEVSGAMLRRVAQALRGGYSWVATMELLDVSRKVVQRVSTFLDIPQAREAKLRASALRTALREGTVADFQEREGVGRELARRHMRQARETLEALREDGALGELGMQ